MLKNRNEEQAAALLKMAEMLRKTRIQPSVFEANARRNRSKKTVGQVIRSFQITFNELRDLLRPFEAELADDLVLELLALL